MECPVCATQLAISTHESVELRACPSCHGQWLSAEGLWAALDDLQAPRPAGERAKAAALAGDASTTAPDRRPALACAVCRVPMQRVIHASESGVWVDVCDAHGVWLDRGEFERLEAYWEALGEAPEPAVRSGGDAGGPSRVRESAVLGGVEVVGVSIFAALRNLF